MSTPPVPAVPARRCARAFAACALAPVVLLALLAASGCGSSGDEAPGDGRKGSLAVSRPGELLQAVRDRVRALASTGAGPTAGSLTPSVMSFSVSRNTPQPAAAGGDASAPRSSPLLQEDGVDEPDLLLSGGAWVHTLQPSAGAHHAGAHHAAEFTAWWRGPDGRVQAQGRLVLQPEGQADVTQLGMVYDRTARSAVVLGQRWETVTGIDLCGQACLSIAPVWMSGSVHVQRVALDDPAQPRAGERLSIEGRLVDARRVGDQLLVVTVHAPFLAPLALPADATAQQREAALAALRADELLPGLRRNGGARQPLLSESDCWVQRDNASAAVEFTTLTLIDLANPALPQKSRCFIGGTEALYMTPTRLVLATSRWSMPSGNRLPAWNPDIATDLHLFSFDGAQLQWRASGSVPGHLGWQREQRSLRLGAHGEHLRVLTYTGGWGWWDAASSGAQAPSPARLTVLREDGSTLRELATLPNARRPALIGKPGEQVYGVRFVGTRGYVVTFRRTDPLYVLDLSDPADPRIAGELEVAGFSEHLVPLGETHLLGVGRDADANGVSAGLKVSLLDVRDASAPREQAVLALGAAGSRSAMDHSRLGLALARQGAQARAALPVALTATPWGVAQRGLQRLAIDTAAGTLQALPLLALADGSDTGWAPLWQERALIVGAQAYHLHDGVLDTHDW